MDNPTQDQSWSCEVRARDQVIRYRCEGSGRPLIVLQCGAALDAAWTELLAGLARSYRVITPEPPPAGADPTEWLDAFLEGLGGSGIRLIALGRFCVPAFDLALDEADRIARLVLIPERPGLETGSAPTPVPLLVAHQGEPAAQLLARVTAFLGSAGAAPAQALA